MSRFKLDIPPDPELVVIGISSHEKDYRLCWALNKHLEVQMGRSEKDVVDNDGGLLSAFTVFDHNDDDEHFHLSLVNNHGPHGVLLKEHRHTDYFLLINNDAPISTTELLARVRNTPFVLTAFELDYHTLREGHKLLDRGE